MLKPSPPLERRDADVIVHSTMHVVAAHIETTGRGGFKRDANDSREVALLLLWAWGSESSEALRK